MPDLDLRSEHIAEQAPFLLPGPHLGIAPEGTIHQDDQAPTVPLHIYGLNSITVAAVQPIRQPQNGTECSDDFPVIGVQLCKAPVRQARSRPPVIACDVGHQQLLPLCQAGKARVHDQSEGSPIMARTLGVPDIMQEGSVVQEVAGLIRQFVRIRKQVKQAQGQPGVLQAMRLIEAIASSEVDARAEGWFHIYASWMRRTCRDRHCNHARAPCQVHWQPGERRQAGRAGPPWPLSAESLLPVLQQILSPLRPRHTRLAAALDSWYSLPRRCIVLRWIDPKPVDIPLDLRAAVGGHPLLAETLVRRHVETAEAARRFLDPSAYSPADPSELPDLPLAAERLRLALRRGERIAIWGDFDADGQTATALLLENLRALGADVIYHVPGRDEGHGVHKAGIDRLSAAGTRLIVTCDTGVTAHASLTHARTLGVDVIVTDHHVPDEELPPAVAVVNPHRLPPRHPMGTLSGVGVAFELARALQPESADRALDLVALGLVADVATLVGDARYLVQRGLEHLRHTRRLGLQAVCQSAELRPEGITEEHVAFVLAPRLNATGRLADAALGVELLTTDDLLRARVLAAEVEGLNSRRQWLSRQVTDAALAQIERQPSLLTDCAVLVLSHSTWPVGIIGIVAGRLAERFGKPAVLIATPPGELASGSGRSVPGIDLVAALRDSAAHLERFGGHAGAAGFGIQSERIPEFRVSLSRAIEAQARALPEPTLEIDAYVRISDLTLDLVSSTSRLAPFGPGNPPLALAVCNIRIAAQTTMGRAAEHRRLVIEDAEGSTQTVFWWHGADWPLPQSPFDLALTARASDYRGQVELRVEWLDARLHDAETIGFPAAPAILVQDCRALRDVGAVLDGLSSEGGLQLWAEGPPAVAGLRPGQQASGRHQLAPGSRLVIWTLPPGPQELGTVLTLVLPQEVFFFASDPGLSTSGAFLSYLARLVKYALRAFDGRVELVSAAVATAHRISTVKAGIEWLAAQGQVAIVDRGCDVWKLAAGIGRVDGTAAQGAEGLVGALLSETGAYRDYLRNVPEETLGAHVSAAADRTEE